MHGRNIARVMPNVDRRRRHPERRQADPISSILGPSGIGVLPGDDPETTTDIGASLPVIATDSRTGPVSLSLPTLSLPLFPSSTSGHPATISSIPQSLTSGSSTQSSPLDTNSSTIVTSSSTTLSRISTSTSVEVPSQTASPTSSATATRAAAQEEETETQNKILTVITSVSGSVTITSTSIIGPSASLSAAPNRGSFFANETQAALVLTFVILIGLVLFSFLGYRFYKTVKRVQEERESEDLARSTRYRTRIDDGEDEDGAPYGRGMTQLQVDLPVNGTLDLLPDGASACHLEDRVASLSIRRRVSSLDRLDNNARPSLPDTVEEHLVSRPSADSYETLSMRSKRSNISDGSHSRSATIHTPEGLQRSPTTHSSKSTPNYLSTQPFPPPITLPDFFGEDGPKTPLRTPLQDHEDYQHKLPRVLKIANE